MSEDISTTAGEIGVSRQLLAGTPRIDWAGLVRVSSPEERAAYRAKREAEWDKKTAEGLVGIADYGDEDKHWVRVERGHSVQKWVTGDAWTRYANARQELDEAEEAL